MKKKSYLDNPATLKIDLMLRGLRIADPLVKAWACGATGIDIMLPGRTIANIPCSEGFTAASPYAIRKRGERYAITDGTGEVEVSLVPRPKFYDGKTSTGVSFSKIAQVHGSLLVITPSPACEFFNAKVECRYCAGNFDRTGKEDAVYTVEDVVETVGAAIAELGSPVVYLSIGFSRDPSGGMEFLRPYLQAIKRHYNCLTAVEALPPKDNHWIDETYAMGADSALYNVEIYDEELFKIICPGRATLIGRKRYLDALEYAAKIFPSGTVSSHLIVGLEPPGSTCQGIDFLTGIGVVPVLPIYRPTTNKALRIDPLTTEIIIPVYKHLYKAVKTKGINLNWVRDLSMVTTPVELKGLVEGAGKNVSLVDTFYGTRLGKKAAWGMSTLRRKLRVKGTHGQSGH
ncbi:MAG: radical SAM protein [Deltaproteobacteria bacterium]|nr:radical SAM protein [Deltaproteobacteria bacterium]